jgi:type II pantothenate kinase
LCLFRSTLNLVAELSLRREIERWKIRSLQAKTNDTTRHDTTRHDTTRHDTKRTKVVERSNPSSNKGPAAGVAVSSETCTMGGSQGDNGDRITGVLATTSSSATTITSATAPRGDARDDVTVDVWSFVAGAALSSVVWGCWHTYHTRRQTHLPNNMSRRTTQQQQQDKGVHTEMGEDGNNGECCSSSGRPLHLQRHNNSSTFLGVSLRLQGSLALQEWTSKLRDSCTDLMIQGFIQKEHFFMNRQRQRRTRWPWDRKRQQSSHSSTGNSTVQDEDTNCDDDNDNNMNDDPYATSLKRPKDKKKSSSLLSSISTSTSTSSQSSHSNDNNDTSNNKSREAAKKKQRNRNKQHHDIADVCIGSIFGMDVGGTLVKLVYFEQRDDPRQKRTHKILRHHRHNGVASSTGSRNNHNTLHHLDSLDNTEEGPSIHSVSYAHHLQQQQHQQQLQQKQMQMQENRRRSVSETLLAPPPQSPSPSSQYPSTTTTAHGLMHQHQLPSSTPVSPCCVPQSPSHSHAHDQQYLVGQSFSSSRSHPPYLDMEDGDGDDSCCSRQETTHTHTHDYNNITMEEEYENLQSLVARAAAEAEEPHDQAIDTATASISSPSPSCPQSHGGGGGGSGGGLTRSSSMVDMVLRHNSDTRMALDKFYKFAKSIDEAMKQDGSGSSSSTGTTESESTTTGVKDQHLSFYSRELGGDFHFVRFETRRMTQAMTLIQTYNLHQNIYDIGSTGGGAHKFSQLWQDQLGIELEKWDELESLVVGMQFVLADVVGEAYSFQPAHKNNTTNTTDTKDNPKAAVGVGTSAIGKEKKGPTPKSDNKSRNNNSTNTSTTSTPIITPKWVDEWWWSRKVKRDVAAESSSYPYLLVTIGTGVSIVRVDGPRQHERISGSTIGGGTYWGLCRLLTQVENFGDALNLAMQGDPTKVDMMVGDIYGNFKQSGDDNDDNDGSDDNDGTDNGSSPAEKQAKATKEDEEMKATLQKLGLSSNVVASSFGKLVAKTDPASGLTEEDLARALLMMVTNNIGQVAYLNAQLHHTSRIYFVGNFLRQNQISQKRLAFAIDFWSKGQMEALFLEHEGYFGALGAFLLSQGLAPSPSTPSAQSQSQAGTSTSKDKDGSNSNNNNTTSASARTSTSTTSSPTRPMTMHRRRDTVIAAPSFHDDVPRAKSSELLLTNDDPRLSESPLWSGRSSSVVNPSSAKLQHRQSNTTRGGAVAISAHDLDQMLDHRDDKAALSPSGTRQQQRRRRSSTL